MKKEIKMYTVKCDLCNTHFTDEHTGFVGWTDYEGARENAMDSEWIENWQQGEEQKHYCPDCYTVNNEDEVVDKKTSAFLFNN